MIIIKTVGSMYSMLRARRILQFTVCVRDRERELTYEKVKSLQTEHVLRAMTIIIFGDIVFVLREVLYYRFNISYVYFDRV